MTVVNKPAVHNKKCKGAEKGGIKIMSFLFNLICNKARVFILKLYLIIPFFVNFARIIYVKIFLSIFWKNIFILGLTLNLSHVRKIESFSLQLLTNKFSLNKIA